MNDSHSSLSLSLVSLTRPRKLAEFRDMRLGSREGAILRLRVRKNLSTRVGRHHPGLAHSSRGGAVWGNKISYQTPSPACQDIRARTYGDFAR